MKLKLVSTFFCMILVSCSDTLEERVQSIDVASGMVALQTLDVTDIAKSISYVPLETTDSSLIGDRPYIRKVKNKLLVASVGRPVLVFDSATGKFIKTLGSIGQGEGEYIPNDNFPICWCDEKEGVVFVKTEGNRILRYDLDGNYIDMWDIPKEEVSLASCSQIVSGTWMYFYEKYLFSNKKYDILKLNLQSGLFSNEISEQTIPVKEEFRTMPVWFDGFGKIPLSPSCQIYSLINDRYVLNYKEDPCLWNYKDKVYFKERFNDTIYQVRNNQLLARYVFNLGDGHCPYSERYNVEGSQTRISIEYVLEGEKAIYFMLKTNYYNLLESKIYWGVYDKSSQIVKVSDLPRLEDTTNRSIVEELHSATSDGTIVGLVTVEKYMEHSGSYDASMSEDDNPVAVILK